MSELYLKTLTLNHFCVLGLWVYNNSVVTMKHYTDC